MISLCRLFGNVEFLQVILDHFLMPCILCVDPQFFHDLISSPVERFSFIRVQSKKVHDSYLQSTREDEKKNLHLNGISAAASQLLIEDQINHLDND